MCHGLKNNFNGLWHVLIEIIPRRIYSSSPQSHKMLSVLLSIGTSMTRNYSQINGFYIFVGGGAGSFSKWFL